MQVAEPDKEIPRGVHCVCRLGTCGFYALGVDKERRQIRVDSELVENLAALCII